MQINLWSCCQQSALFLLPLNQWMELDLQVGWDTGICEAINNHCSTCLWYSWSPGFADFALGSCCCLKVHCLPCLISSWLAWLILETSSWVSNNFVMGCAHATSFCCSESLWDVAKVWERPHTIWEQKWLIGDGSFANVKVSGCCLGTSHYLQGLLVFCDAWSVWKWRLLIAASFLTEGSLRKE